jgi:hypothetical protein
MSMNRRSIGRFLPGLIALLVCSAAFGGTAVASPTWKFNGTTLVGAETIAGGSSAVSFSFPGLTTKCQASAYKMTISNSAGTGVGELTALSFSTCTTNTKACTVASIGAKGLPWPLHLTKVGTGNYIVLEKIEIDILYAGAECALDGTVVTIAGSAGALFNNPTSSFTFNLANSSATMSSLGGSTEWKGTYTAEATGAHSGQILIVS